MIDREALILDNVGLAKKIAHKYAPRIHDSAVSWDDLFSEGCLALVKAAERFEPDKGIKFSTYAWHYIWGTIIRAFDCKGFVYVPVPVRELGRKIIKHDLEYNSVQEIAIQLNVSERMAARAKRYLRIEAASLDYDSADAAHPSDIDFQSYYNYAPQYEDYTTAFVEDFKATLKQPQRDVLELRLEGKEYREISEVLGITFQGCHNRMVRVKKALEQFQIAGGM
jgi:RNA polymerase sigma factor (sigma-70 family)